MENERNVLLNSDGISCIGTPGKNGGAGGNLVADFGHEDPLRPEDHIDARTKLNVADTFARRDGIARLLVTNDAAGDETGNLAADYARARTLDNQRVLFVFG